MRRYEVRGTRREKKESDEFGILPFALLRFVTFALSYCHLKPENKTTHKTRNFH
jgi:hypothetical protein